MNLGGGNDEFVQKSQPGRGELREQLHSEAQQVRWAGVACVHVPGRGTHGCSTDQLAGAPCPHCLPPKPGGGGVWQQAARHPRVLSPGQASCVVRGWGGSCCCHYLILKSGLGASAPGPPGQRPLCFRPQCSSSGCVRAFGSPLVCLGARLWFLRQLRSKFCPLNMLWLDDMGFVLLSLKSNSASP